MIIVTFIRNISRKAYARLMAVKQWFSRSSKESVIRFKCVFGGYYTEQPVELAKKVLPDWFRAQVKTGVAKFARCPGMYDFFQEGYIIPAPYDIHIKANRMGVVVETPNNPFPELISGPMEFEVVDGLVKFDDDVKKTVFKLPLPWGMYAEPGYSAHLFPALMHSPFLRDLYVYPGTVDYERFHTANFIFSPMRACEIVIPAGTPLLHVLPFKRVDFHAVVGRASTYELDRHRFGFTSRVKAAYRKVFHHKKHYSLEVENER